MPRYQKWVLTLGILAATPGIGMAGPFDLFKGIRQTDAPKTEHKASTEELRAANQKTAQSIADALRSAHLNGQHIEIEFKNGVATLSGAVDEAKQQEEATKIVKTVEGVQSVNNQLKVAQSDKAPKRNFADLFAPSSSQTKPSPTGIPVTNPPIRQTSVDAAPAAGGFIPRVDNQQMAERIAAALSSVKLNGFNIEILYDNGTAVLRGSVSDAAQRRLAHEAASRVPGVRQVSNELKLNGQPVKQAAWANEPVAAPQAAMPVQPTGYRQPMPEAGMPPALPSMPAPPSYGHPGSGAAHTVYNMPNLPDYAWPSYASYPNYSQVTYPKQYSASAWPYIGPFYPYPQIPLGWRQAQLQWDDGHWQLDFDSRTDKWWWFVNPKNW